MEPSAQATSEHVVEQIAYLLQVGGEDCPALGSDFDGISQVPEGLETYNQIPKLIGLLEKRGFGAAVIEKVMGGNLLRLCREVLG